MSAIDLLPLVAAAAAIPQLLPQLQRVRRLGTADGVSPAWAVLTAVGNLGWLAYFVSTGLFTAIPPVTTCAVLAAGIVVALAKVGVAVRGALVVGAAWATVLVASTVLGGATGLGSALAIAFALQVVPSVRTALRSPSTAGISRMTWALIGVEVTCWGTIGLLDGRPPLIALGATGLTAVALMLWLSRPGRGVVGPHQPLGVA